MQFRSSWICRTICILMFLVGLSGAKPFGNKNNNMNNKANNNHRRGGNNNIGGGGDDHNHNNGDDTIANLRVSCRSQWYGIQDVSTISDLMQQLHQQSSSTLSRQELQTAKLLYRGKVLDQRRSPKLKDYGIQEGDVLFVVPEGYRFKVPDALACFLDIMVNGDKSHNQEEDDPALSPLAKLLAQIQEEDINDFWQAWDHLLLHLPREELTQVLRTELDLAYHRLRSLWEQPAFRQALANPVPIEVYRQVLTNHLPQSIQKDLPPSTKKLLQNPLIWRHNVLRLTDGILRFGDMIMDSLLDLVLDVVQGAGKSSLSSEFATSRTTTKQQLHQEKTPQSHDHYQPTMEDPTKANQMLFELSESEDD